MSENLTKNINNSTQTTIIDPFCKQAWIEYGRRFCINSVTGLAVGAVIAFLGKPTYRAASMALGLGWGIGSSWSRTNIDIHNRREAKRKHKN